MALARPCRVFLARLTWRLARRRRRGASDRTLVTGQLCGDALVAVVQPTDRRRRHDPTGRGRWTGPASMPRSSIASGGQRLAQRLGKRSVTGTGIGQLVVRDPTNQDRNDALRAVCLGELPGLAVHVEAGAGMRRAHHHQRRRVEQMLLNRRVIFDAGEVGFVTTIGSSTRFGGGETLRCRCGTGRSRGGA